MTADDDQLKLIEPTAQPPALFKIEREAWLDDIQRGDVFEFPNGHRLMCGDATSADDRAALFDDAQFDLLFTSPSYPHVRDYAGVQRINDWTGMMIRALINPPAAPAAQLLVNLGVQHRDGEFQEYWRNWLDHMRKEWRFYSQYIWRKSGILGASRGRLHTNHEYLFHFNKTHIKLNRTEPTTRTHVREVQYQITPNGTQSQPTGKRQKIPALRVPSSVIAIGTEGTPQAARKTTHPAVFPIRLPRLFIETFTQRGAVVYDAFSGSGTTIMACEETGRTAYAMELSPTYVAETIERFRAHHGGTARQIKHNGERP